jgi:hypothetical protein
MRINPKMSGAKISTPVSQEKQISELNDIEQTLEDFRVSLSIRRSKRGLVQDMREAIDAILKHLDRHGESLWGHVVHLPEEVGGGIRLIERTNIDAEGFFNVYKQGERRRSGRKVLSQDLESTPPESALVKNIKDTSYIQILCGSIEKLPEAFAKLDKEKESKSNRNILDKQKDKIETASLSRSDKIFIRKIFLGEKILGAAASCPRKIVPIQI